MITTALVFDHRARTAPDKEGPIEVRVTIDRAVRYVNTGVHVLKKHWQHGLVLDRYDADELNERLIILKKRVESLINIQLSNNQPVDINAVRANLYALQEQLDDNSFLTWVEEQIGMLDVKSGTLQHYSTLYSRLNEFNRIRSWKDLTPDNIYKFDQWIRENIRTVAGEPISQAAVYTYHKNLRALMQRAYKVGKLLTIDDNPYTKLKGEFGKGVKENIEYLTDEEMQLILNLHPTAGSSLAITRDIFVVQMFTGLSYSDAMLLNIDNYRLIKGKYVYNGERVKTGVPYVSSLLPPVVEVLERNNMKMPQMGMQQYNANLKTIGTTLGIHTRMHSHLARHTFATYMLRNGVKIENLARMLGHTDIKQTQRYAKVLALSVHEDFDMIAEKLTKHKNTIKTL